MNIERQNPLKWPEGWQRTRIQERKPNGGWKKTFQFYESALAKELGRMGAEEILISFNSTGTDRQDCGVAVYFSKTMTEDYSWQDGLGLMTPAPTMDEINSAFRNLAKKVHPDGPTPDIPTFQALTKHRDKAINWIKGTDRNEHEYVIPCDRFNETRLNLAALSGVVRAFRVLDKAGVPGILERTFKGFKTALPAHVEKEA
jgi:hypothetical protein